jgi:hypothetical protein
VSALANLVPIDHPLVIESWLVLRPSVHNDPQPTCVCVPRLHEFHRRTKTLLGGEVNVLLRKRIEGSALQPCQKQMVSAGVFASGTPSQGSYTFIVPNSASAQPSPDFAPVRVSVLTWLSQFYTSKWNGGVHDHFATFCVCFHLKKQNMGFAVWA